MKLTVEVTQQHIDEGRMCSEHRCPIALAFHGLGFWHVIVLQRQALVEGEWLILPERAVQFIKCFDNEPFCPTHWRDPFTFEIEVPD